MVREWLGPADVVLNEQTVFGIAENSLTIVLERRVLASTEIVHCDLIHLLILFI